MAVPASSDLVPQDTIYALSSGPPPAAIAIIRISGNAAANVLRALTSSEPSPRRASLRILRTTEGDVLDRALTIFFPAPSTATGEDLVELHLHGSRAVVDAALGDLAARGLRHAEPGEFTRRALLNGRLDLTAVEGLADLLAAETDAQRREALTRSDGLLGRRLNAWGRRLIDVAAIMEAVIDYDGDTEVADQEDHIRSEIAGLAREIGMALAVPPAERLRDGIRVVITGPPNAGKSTLFNALVGHEAAIVSPIAGTTRDSIERPIALAGMPFVLIDTAGIRDTADPIESIGVERALLETGRADIVIDLGGSGQIGVIDVAPKSDLSKPASSRLPVSALTGEGLGDLVDRIVERGRMMLPKPGEVSLDRRYRIELRAAHDALELALSETDMLIAADHIRYARSAMDRLTGKAGIEDMLDALFGRFCLGK